MTSCMPKPNMYGSLSRTWSRQASVAAATACPRAAGRVRALPFAREAGPLGGPGARCHRTLRGRALGRGGTRPVRAGGDVDGARDRKRLRSRAKAHDVAAGAAQPRRERARQARGGSTGGARRRIADDEPDYGGHRLGPRRRSPRPSSGRCRPPRRRRPSSDPRTRRGRRRGSGCGRASARGRRRTPLRGEPRRAAAWSPRARRRPGRAGRRCPRPAGAGARPPRPPATAARSRDRRPPCARPRGAPDAPPPTVRRPPRARSQPRAPSRPSPACRVLGSVRPAAQDRPGADGQRERGDERHDSAQGHKE